MPAAVAEAAGGLIAPSSRSLPRRLAAAALVCGALGVSPALADDAVAPPGKDPLATLQQPGDEVVLSDEQAITRWANPLHQKPIRSAPRAGARVVGHLKFVSPSKAATVYGLLRAHLDEDGTTWLLVRIPGRPNGRTGWARAQDLGDIHLSRMLLVVDRHTLRATLYRSGRRIFRGPVGVGKASTPTPAGHFFVDREEGEIFGPSYGPHVLFTSAFSSLADWPGGGVVGMHGTNLPALVPGRPSHGCIRLHNNDINRLARLVHVPTPLLIR